MGEIMSNDNSVFAYRQLKSSGQISDRQLQAWWFLTSVGPMTGRELDRAASRDGLWKRLSELAALGLIVKDSTRDCRISGRLSTVWRAVVPVGELSEAMPRLRAAKRDATAVRVTRTEFWKAVRELGEMPGSTWRPGMKLHVCPDRLARRLGL